MTCYPVKTYHFYLPKFQVAKRQEDKVDGWYVAGGKMPKANFWRWYFQTHFSPANLHLEELQLCNYLGSPQMLKRPIFSLKNWGSQCTGNQNKEWKSGEKTLYVVIRAVHTLVIRHARHVFRLQRRNVVKKSLPGQLEASTRGGAAGFSHDVPMKKEGCSPINVPRNYESSGRNKRFVVNFYQNYIYIHLK